MFSSLFIGGSGCFRTPSSITIRKENNCGVNFSYLGGGDLSEPAQTLPEVIPESKPNPAPVTVSPPEPKKPATKVPEVLQSAMKQIAKERGEKGFTGLGCF